MGFEELQKLGDITAPGEIADVELARPHPGLRLLRDAFFFAIPLILIPCQDLLFFLSNRPQSGPGSESGSDKGGGV